MMEKAERSISIANSETFLFPTSFAQQRLWFFEQLYPGSTVYHLSTVLPFEGLLDRKALEESLCDLIDRHEALRTTFTALDGAPVQLIAPACTLTCPCWMSASQGTVVWNAPGKQSAPYWRSPSIWSAVRCCAPAWCGLSTIITGWCSIISLPTVGRSKYCIAICVHSMKPGAGMSRQHCRHFLSSMRTLPAGNGVSCKGSD